MSDDGTDLGAGDYRGAFELLAGMTRDFAATADLESTLERTVSAIATHVDAEAGSLWFVEDGGETLECRACIGPDSIAGLKLPAGEGIVGKSVRENVCQSVFDVSSDPAFSGKMDEQSGFVTRSILCSPLRSGDDVIGAVELINKRSRDGHFDEGDALLLQSLTSSAGLAIANARLTASHLENERVRRELELAAEIQRGLMPPQRSAPFPVYGINVPARTVSGDFFDVVVLPEGGIAFCLGDVSGKGINAALLMAKTASVYRCLARDIQSPGTLLARLNEEIAETVTRGMFVTMVAGILEGGTVRLANAGHEPPLLRLPGGRFTSYEADAPPLGIVPGVEFPEVELSMDGGCLYVCSDGLTETACSEREMLGAEGLQELADRFAAKPLGERIDAIVAEVSECELRDDLTLLGVSDEERAR